MERVQVASWLGRPVDIASIVAFRVAFGAILVWEVFRYFDHGWIHRYYIAPSFHFTYHGFDWIRPWPGDGMLWHFAVLGLLAACIAVGAFYRAAATLFFLGFTYVFLLDQAQYLNHFYLISLLALLLAVLPAHRALSIDAWRRPALRSRTAPAWSLWLLRFQVGAAYFFAGVAKLNADWLGGEPMGMWLAARTDFAWIGAWFDEPSVALAASWGSALFDLTIVPALLWSRTRLAAYLVAVAFHLMNAALFQIGVFPWLMIAATTVFLPPSWPRRGLARLGIASAIVIPRSRLEAAAPRPAWIFTLLAFALVQVVVPLRHFAIPSHVHWSEEGHRFAWHMKLRDKRARAELYVFEPETGRMWGVEPRDHLTPRQARKMAARPDMLVQFARYIATVHERHGQEGLQVVGFVHASLNGRPHQLLVDPTVNLAALERRRSSAAPWILPLESVLPRREREERVEEVSASEWPRLP